MSDYWKQILGWFDFSKIYDDMVEQADNGFVFVEIGAWFGKSTSYMANKIKESKKNIKFFTVDTWKGSAESDTQKQIAEENNYDLFPMFWENMIKARVEKYIEPLQMKSIEAAKLFNDESIDFIFIDASHLYEAVKSDIESWYPKLKKQGFIGGHDINPRFQVVDAVKDCFGNNFKIVKSSMSDSWIHKKDTNQL